MAIARRTDRRCGNHLAWVYLLHWEICFSTTLLAHALSYTRWNSTVNMQLVTGWVTGNCNQCVPNRRWTQTDLEVKGILCCRPTRRCVTYFKGGASADATPNRESRSCENLNFWCETLFHFKLYDLTNHGQAKASRISNISTIIWANNDYTETFLTLYGISNVVPQQVVHRTDKRARGLYIRTLHTALQNRATKYAILWSQHLCHILSANTICCVVVASDITVKAYII